MSARGYPPRLRPPAPLDSYLERRKQGRQSRALTLFSIMNHINTVALRNCLDSVAFGKLFTVFELNKLPKAFKRYSLPTMVYRFEL
ncbi:hypothetical protein EVAR_29566_1 [Eumeta japonica]|uniref:Uncharacterized protein n=1 Tax=Eumeta variegata TaxID=151549 RepID=A0A4C1VUV2_EUMVA|nr:hypothetical protein EVAR_29566_1 [Eumeta japonica]